jgi:protein-S-isoprenylcysteine O-methyltransferase Ste14
MSERNLDLAFAGTLLSWGALAVVTAVSRGSSSPIPFAVALLHAVVALEIARRSRLLRRPRAGAVALSLPAIAMGAAALAFAAPIAEWPRALETLFLLGAGVTAASFLSLGRCFGVLPGFRGVVTGGPYRFVRHPAYLGELLMVLAAALSQPSLRSATLFVLAVVFIGLRVRVEEALLNDSELYRRYAERTAFRLLPGVW